MKKGESGGKEEEELVNRKLGKGLGKQMLHLLDTLTLATLIVVTGKGVSWPYIMLQAKKHSITTKR